MDDFTRRKINRLRSLLDGLNANRNVHMKAKHLEVYVTPDEYREYQRSLAANRIAPSKPELSREAQEYWDAFRVLCKRVNLANSREQRNRLVDEAAELMEHFEALPIGEQGRFRTLDPSRGDTRWAAALHELEHDLPFLDEEATRSSHLDHVENHTQREFLTDLIERLDPSEMETTTPEQDAQWRGRAKMMRELARRLSR